jgi:hypothetical protein
MMSLKIFWSLQDIPELSHLTPEQQKLAFRECYQNYLAFGRLGWPVV